VRSAIDERLRAANTLQIHGLQWNLDSILDGVKRCRKYDWHGRRSVWKPPDVVVYRKTGKLSLDLALAADQYNFEASKAGWKMEERPLRYRCVGTVRIRRPSWRRIHQWPTLDLPGVL
jgi:hypothetical protein